MQGSVAFVTGGASGIGRATVRMFNEQGVDVALVDIDEKALRDTSEEFAGPGARILPIVADLTDTSRLDGWFQAAVAKFGRVDYLVNSAAVLGVIYDFLEVDESDWDRTFQINLKVPMLLMQSFARHAIARGGGGRIVNLSSSSAFRARQNSPAYGCSKGAINTLTRIVAAQLGAHDINVNAVAPGVTHTPGTTSRRGVDVAALKQTVSEGPHANFFKRLTEAEDIAAAILFLCSPGSRQVTGQVINVSAGAVT